MSSILIGCPVYGREKVLPLWFKLIEQQTWPLSQIGFIFECGPNDDPTHQVLWDFQQNHPELLCFDLRINEVEQHRIHPDKHRTWTQQSYHKMCRLRNELLDRAIVHDFDRYFSLDSDIILEDPQTLEKLFDLTKDNTAASPLSYMTPTGHGFPSVMTWVKEPGGRARRVLRDYPIGKTFKADIIMAAVMMGRDVYKYSRYRPHRQGEDLGWSYECYKNQFDLYAASGIYTPHLMHGHMVNQYIENGDPRSPFPSKNI